MIYNRKSKKKDILMYVAFSVLLIFCVCFSVTGAWFTDTSSVKGGLTNPDFTFNLVDQNGASQEQVFYVSPANTSDLSKQIDIKTTSNVDKLVVRYWITQEWGTMSGSTFTPSEDAISNGLTINNPDWTRGYYYIVDEFGGSISEYASSGIYYYYNNVVKNATITAIKGFTAKSGYENLTCKITIYVEVAPASDLTLDTMWKVSDSAGNIADGSATDSWIASIKGQR